MPSIAHLFPPSRDLFPDALDCSPVTTTPPTFGQRVKHARMAAGMTQEQFASAIAKAGGTKTNKGSVSQYESDKVKNPFSATVLAISAVTGFAQDWLVHGRGPQRATLPELTDRNSPTARLVHRAALIALDVCDTPAHVADATVAIFCTLADEPDAPDAALRRIARQVRIPKKS